VRSPTNNSGSLQSNTAQPHSDTTTHEQLRFDYKSNPMANVAVGTTTHEQLSYGTGFLPGVVWGWVGGAHLSVVGRGESVGFVVR